MTITLNGTTGITTPDITSSGALGVDASAPDNSLVVNSSGNVGIGTSSPLSKLHINDSTGSAVDLLTLQTGWNNPSGNKSIVWRDSTNNLGRISVSYSAGGGSKMSFGSLYNGGYQSADLMTLDSSGSLLVGTTSIGGTGTYRGISLAGGSVGSFGGTYDYLGALYRYDSVYENGFGFWNTRGGASPVGGPILKFYVGSSFAIVGSISASSTSTSYNTTSDYRLKEDWQPMTGASERVKALKPINFAWKVDGSRVDGFLAHEAQAVVPEAVTGVKDAVDAEGKPEYQGIDQSKLVPLLTAALQEALTKIDALTARVEALEGATT